MFKKNVVHLQSNLLSTVALLPKNIIEFLQKSWAAIFYQRIFRKIDENKFSLLFSTKKSRPNFPINIYVALEIMKNLFNWSDEEMISNFHLNLQVCYAVGIENIGDITLSPRTVYYNRKRIIKYEEETGINLFNQVFEEITLAEIKALNIDTSIQRMDSTMISSNIKKMSRLEIALKVLQNFYRDLPAAQCQRLHELVKDYIDKDAAGITYKLKNSELDDQLKRVGEILLYMYTLYHNDINVNPLKSFEHVRRVLDEQFSIADDHNSITQKSPQEISSSSLQNPADDEATYRCKKNQDYQGYALNIAETCAKDNKTQLITDVAVFTNNTSDEQILRQRLPDLKHRTHVEEMVVDGGYSGEITETVCETEKVKLIFTGIKGAKQSDDKLRFHNFNFNEGQIESCPQGHKPISQKYNSHTQRYVVHFDKEQCSGCPLREQCCVHDRKNYTTLYFNVQHVRVAKKRQQFTEEQYCTKQRLRPAIEGTMSLFKRRTYNGKLRVRGLKRVRNVVILTALAINFRRIMAAVDDIFCGLFEYIFKIIRILFNFDFQSTPMF